ncbi:MAG: hypothetical protein Q7T40_04225 [Methylobacter sp.]|nr:hypothetical protein [Methylobacter sp.]
MKWLRRAIGASFFVSLMSLTGLFALWIEPERLKRIIPYIFAFGIGFMQSIIILEHFLFSQ